MSKAVKTANKALRRLINYQASSKDYQLYPEAFAFLERCLEAEIDLTSVEALKIAPENVLKELERNRRKEDVWKTEESKGDPAVLKLCSQFFAKQGLDCDVSHLSLNDGVLTTIDSFLSRISDVGKVIVPTPTFGYYLRILQKRGLEIEVLPTRAEAGYLPTANDLSRVADREGSNVMLMCYPNNPAGVVMTKERAEELAEVCTEKDIFVISDEVFAPSPSLSGRKHFPIAGARGMLDRSLTVTGVTKSMRVPGLKTGICLGPDWAVDGFAKIGGYSEFDEAAISAALEHIEEESEFSKDSKDEYLGNIEESLLGIDRMNKAFSKKAKVDRSIVKPLVRIPDRGGPYVLDFSGARGCVLDDGKVLETGLDIAEWVLESASVGTVPGECYLLEPESMTVRISIGNEREVLREAFGRMEAAVDKVVELPTPVPSPAPSAAQLLDKDRGAAKGGGGDARQ